MHYDSRQDTLDHIERVRHRMNMFIAQIAARAERHDRSKLQEPEKSTFDRVTPRLRELTYGSDEYRAALADMGDALKHHYEYNSHHPEHYSDGVNGMNLLDVVEMLCDWKAASERHADGDFAESLKINTYRFGIDTQLAAILSSTAHDLGFIIGAESEQS